MTAEAPVAPLRVLMTGFDPFGGERTNAALEAVRRLPERIGGAEIIVLEVPTRFGRCVRETTAAIDALRPAAVVCVGQAAGRADITPERVAINLDDARIPDNAGAQPIDAPIEPGGPPACFATLPVKAMVRAIRQAGVPAQLSNTAGTYVCNHLMYGVLRHLATRGPAGSRGGFVHVPLMAEQAAAGAPSLPLGDLARGLEAAIAAVIEHEDDIALAEGAIA